MPLLSSTPKLVDYSQPSLSHQPPLDPFPFLRCYSWLFIYVIIIFSYVVILIYFYRLLFRCYIFLNCCSIVLQLLPFSQLMLHHLIYYSIVTCFIYCSVALPNFIIHLIQMSSFSFLLHALVSFCNCLFQKNSLRCLNIQN
jgi:hypothetical protein